jgi:hypothetical protein
MKPDDTVEENPGHRCRRVRVTQRQEVCVLRKSVYNGEGDRLAVDARKAFNKIHGDVGPDGGCKFQRLEQAGRMKLLRLVALTSSTRPDEVPHCLAHTWIAEIYPKPMERFLGAFVADAMHALQDVRNAW